METLNKKPVIFLVDDDKVFATALSHLLSGNNNEEINVYSTGEECLKHMHEQPDIVILDYKLNCHLPDAMNGMEVLKKIKNLSLNTEVIMLSSQDNVDVAIDAIKYGAYDYVTKSDSAFVKIKNITKHILGTLKLNQSLKAETKLYNWINAVIIITFIVIFILNKLL